MRDNMKKKIITTVSVTSVILVAVWICFVINANNKWTLPQTIYYSEGDTAEYESDIYYSITESRDGYSAVLKNAYIIDMDSFLEKYKLTEEIFENRSFIPQSVYCVEIEFFNTDNITSGIDLINMRLSCKSCVLEISNELWDAIYPNLAGQSGFKLRENSSKTMLLPYVFVSPDYETMKYDNLQWELNLSQYPTRKIMSVEF